MRSGKKYCSAGRRRLKIILAAGLAALALGGLAIGAAYFLIYSKTPIVRSLRVQGNRTLSSEFVASLIRGKIIGKGGWRSFLGADNIASWTFKKDDLNDQPLHPWIKRVLIKENILKREVDINVSERDIFTILCLPHQCYGLDEAGVAFTRTPGGTGYLVKVIFDENERSVRLGKLVFNNDLWLRIKSVTEELQGNGLGVGAVEIRKDELGEWTAETAAGPKLIFSVAYDSTGVLEVMKELAKRTDLKTIKEIDFRVPEKVYYR